MTKPGRPRLELDVEAIAADYQAGMSLTACARKYGCTIDTIWRRLIEARVDLRPRSGGMSRPRVDWAAGIAAHQLGATLLKASALCGGSPDGLAKALKRLQR